MNTVSEFLNKKIFMSIQEYKNLLGKYNISDHDKLVYKKIVDDKKKFILSWNIEKNSCYKKRIEKKFKNLNINPDNLILIYTEKDKFILDFIKSINLEILIKLKYLLLIEEIEKELDNYIDNFNDDIIEIHLQECEFEFYEILNNYLNFKYKILNNNNKICGKYISKDMGVLKCGMIKNFYEKIENSINQKYETILKNKIISVENYENILEIIFNNISKENEILNEKKENKTNGFAIYSNINFTILPCFANVIFANRSLGKIDFDYNNIENNDNIFGSFAVNVRGVISYESKIINIHLKLRDQYIKIYDIQKEIINLYNSSNFLIGRNFNSQYQKYFLGINNYYGLNKLFNKIFQNEKIICRNIENFTLAISNILVKHTLSDLLEINQNEIVNDYINLNTKEILLNLNSSDALDNYNHFDNEEILKKFINHFENGFILLGDFNMNLDLLVKNLVKTHCYHKFYDLYDYDLQKYNLINSNKNIYKINKQYNINFNKYVIIKKILKSSGIDHILELAYIDEYNDYQEINDIMKYNFNLSINPLIISENDDKIIFSWNLQRNFLSIKKERDLYYNKMNILILDEDKLEINCEKLKYRNFEICIYHIICNVRWYIVFNTITNIIKNLYSKNKNLIIYFENCEFFVSNSINLFLRDYFQISQYKHIDRNLLYVNKIYNYYENDNEKNKINFNIGYSIILTEEISINIKELVLNTKKKNVNNLIVSMSYYNDYVEKIKLFFKKKNINNNYLLKNDDNDKNEIIIYNSLIYC